MVNRALLTKGYSVGVRLRMAGSDNDGSAGPLIVGVAESTSIRDHPVAVGLLDSLDATATSAPDQRTWLVGGAPITWETVRDLNELGASVLSRAVLLDPPSVSELDPRVATIEDSGRVDCLR